MNASTRNWGLLALFAFGLNVAVEVGGCTKPAPPKTPDAGSHFQVVVLDPAFDAGCGECK